MIAYTHYSEYFFRDLKSLPLSIATMVVSVLEVKHPAYPFKRQVLDLNSLLCTPFINSVVSVVKPPMLVISDAMALLFCTRDATLLIGKQYPKMQRRMTSAAQ